MLRLENIKGGYSNNKETLKGIDLQLRQGETLAIIGQNGAGKSTLAKAMINILPFRSGKLFLNNKDISRLNTKQLNEKGIVYFMQGGRVFNELTVKENISFASLNTKNKELDLNMFPSLRKHWLDEAGLLSGGERHQLALAMTVVIKPKILILDEPSAGLSPVAIKQLYIILESIKTDMNLSIILIEQNVNKAIEFSNQVALMQQGSVETILDTKDKTHTLKTIQNLYF